MRLIKKANKKESKSGSETQKTLRKLSQIYNCEVVYMPYGKGGKGFYIKDEKIS